jgi:hypothetical protein
MPIKDKEVNKNVINIKIGDIDKKKKGKNKKRKMFQKAKQVGSFSYAPSAPSHRPLHPQVPTQSTHYNRAQEANLSTLIGTEAELKQTKEREKTLNSLFDNTASELRKSRERERALNSFISNSQQTSSRKTPLKQRTEVSNNISPIDFMFSPPQNDETNNALFSSGKKDKSINDRTKMTENNNIKADIVLQKEPMPDNDSNNSLYISSESENSPNKSRRSIAHKKVTIMEEPKSEEKVRKISFKEIQKELKNKGFPISFKDEEGKIRMFNKQELLQRYNYVELNKSEKREHEKKPKHTPLLNEDDPEDANYIKALFPLKSNFSDTDYTIPVTEDNQLNNLFSNLNLS